MIWTRMHSFGCISAICLLTVGVNIAVGQTHSASVILEHDPTAANFYSGTSSPPAPIGHISLVGGAPGYLNSVSGGSFSTAAGQVAVGTIHAGSVNLVALAIHVTDTAGGSHSLSSMDDPALADIVDDLNHSMFSGDSPVTAYAYSAAPAQFASAEAALSAGETSNGGQPFDVLLAGNPITGSVVYWTLDLSNEVGSLDGITALTVTDIGSVPEPGAVFVVLGLAGIVLVRRRPSPQPSPLRA